MQTCPIIIGSVTFVVYFHTVLMIRQIAIILTIATDLQRFPEMPIDFDLNKSLCGTLSKAFLKSK